mmetsp:Transcript_12174/g.16811  ORF Transcript_12174/g.16811 Transcript_12174/m.16811 type:complete len:203 (+) Transcript_12174:562-1170(+)
MQIIFESAFGMEEGKPNKWWFGLLCFVVFVPLCFVRKISKFAAFHVFADVMIFCTLISVMIYASITLSKDGNQVKTVNPINWNLFPDSIGFAVYAFEGIGVILPIMDITTCTTEQYIKVVMIVLMLIGCMYVLFSEYCVCAYGDTLTLPLITASLPQDAWETWIILFLFCLNLTFTYPLVIYPANNIVESYIFKGWPKSPKR